MRALVARWNALAPRMRLAAGLFALAALGASAFAFLSQRDTRVALFATPLRTEQVAEVASRLAEWNVPFAETPDNVRVAAAARNALLLRLSVVGIPHAHLASSSDVLEKAGPLTPESVLEAEQRDGLAGDIARGLRGLPGVADATVIIAPASAATFADESSHAATASVRLAVAPGATLSDATLAGIRQYVASGVPGLDARRVAILDDRGLALSADARDAPASEALAMQQSLQSAFDQALGAGAAIVRVRVSYDSRVRELHDVVRKPLGSRAIGTTIAGESYQSPSKRYSKTNRSIDGGSEVQDERVETPAGRLERVSVAVAVDAARRFDLGQIKSLAIGTLGLVSARGDSVSIESIAFPHAPPFTAPAGAGWLALAGELGPAALLALGLVVAVRIGARPAVAICENVVARLAVARTTRAVASFAPSHVRGALANEPPHTAAAIISALPAATATAVLEMYPPEERAAIVRRMSRGAAPAVPDYETVLRRG